MNYLEWLGNTPRVNDLSGIEEDIEREKEETVKIMRRRMKRGKETEKQKAEELLGRANMLYVKGKLPAAIEQIKEALAFHRTSESAYYLLGVIYEEMLEKQKSFNAFLIAASIKKTDLELWDKLYELKKEDGDLEYQLYILNKIKKIRTTADVLAKILAIHQERKNEEKVLETQALLTPHTGFDPALVLSLIAAFGRMRNKDRILGIIEREVDREKNFSLIPDSFLIWYVDLLFMAMKYHTIEKVYNSMKYHNRQTALPERARVIVFFSRILAETHAACFLCRDSQVLCACRDNLVVDEYGNILLENGKDSVLLNIEVEEEAMYDATHQPLVNYFFNLLIRMKKYTLSLFLLLKLEKRLSITHPFPVSAVCPELIPLFRERFSTKKKIAYIHLKSQEFEKSILAYKEMLEHREAFADVFPGIFEEAKMEISKIYDMLGNIDLALEYALQITLSGKTKEEQIERGEYTFHKRLGCMKMQSMMYKTQHISGENGEEEAARPITNSASRRHFMYSAQELVLAFLRNPFIFSKKKKIKKEGKKTGPEESGEIKETDTALKAAPLVDRLVSIKEFENDYELLCEVNGLGSIFHPPPNECQLSVQDKIRYDLLSSLLGGITIEKWSSLLLRYTAALEEEGSHAVALLLLKKFLSSQILRTSAQKYAEALWQAVKMAIRHRDVVALISTVTSLNTFYMQEKSVNQVSVYYLTYFLLSRIPGLFYHKQFFMMQKNMQRALKRKAWREIGGDSGTRQTPTCPESSRGHLINLLLFSHMPSFIYTDTVMEIEKIIDRAGLPATGTSISGIIRAITHASLLLSYAMSRKVVDRNAYIEKGVGILTAHVHAQMEELGMKRNVIRQPPKMEVTAGKITYLVGKKLHPNYLYTDADPEEKLALLLYNLGRAYHQYKLFGLAESSYVSALAYSSSREIHQLVSINLSILKKTVVHKHSEM